ncbi:phosphatidate cytidylyltransferase [Erythrobacter sp. WH131]|uniref:Phosphatidate cytidylyltransferase n=2 Tax=Erythrobacter ani TaxID=2827235 RepID=A0ABS6SR37_9SPHN|nr:phosphatidate cytidylyltransferase [Erythrobacter ani]
MSKRQRAKDTVKGLADLPVRFVSGIVMVGIVSVALWLGGWWWVGFVALLAGLVLWEWNRLVRAFGLTALGEVAWSFFGAAYVSAAAYALMQVRMSYGPLEVLLVFLAPVVAVDVGAYFMGRAVGGPKIAPSISPSKTWAGLIGGALAAGAVGIGIDLTDFGPAAFEGFAWLNVVTAIAAGALVAVLAQSGDFFESWMKRRAGVKDSSNLIPGHGGVFDRADGFLAVYFVVFLIAVVPASLGL